MKTKGIKEGTKKIEKIITLLQKRIGRRAIKVLKKSKVNMPQFHILETLQDEGESTMGQLAERFYVTTSAATNLVTKLLKSNFVIRKHGIKDRRQILIKITKKGERIVTKVWEEVHGFFNSLLADFSQEEKSQWRKLWEKIYSSLGKEKE